MSHDAAAEEDTLEGQFLIAMPGIGDPRFERAVILVCAHSDQGAMGLVINERSDDIDFAGLMEKLEVEIEANGDTPIRLGGPVEQGRGFVLHTEEFGETSALKINDELKLSGTIEVLRAIGKDSGPRKHLITLGYTGWGPGQLEDEIRDNGWLICAAKTDIVFSDSDETKWQDALSILGVSPEVLSVAGGNA